MRPGRTAPAPGAPASVPVAGARRGLVALCVTVTTSYGVLFYAFPVLAPAITADTGWSVATVTALFSAAQVLAGLAGPLVGKWLQVYGPRPVMTWAAVLAAPAVACLALAPNLWLFALAWLVSGGAMAGLFYPQAFAALTLWYGAERVGALTALTLAAGLASTVFAPLAAALEQVWGWRAAYLVLAGVLVVVVLPCHALLLPRSRGETVLDERADASGTRVVEVLRSRGFWALTAALTAGVLTVFAVVVSIVPLLDARGLDTTTAAWLLGAGGVGQVLGRLVYAPLERRLAVVSRTVVVLGACAATTLSLALVPGPWPLLMAMVILAGVARGALTLLHATAVADRWGTGDYAVISGVMHTPLMLATALAPWVGAVLAGALGGYPAAFAVMGVLAAAGAVAALLSRPAPSPPAVS
ncbi:MFS transporter [Nocardiopsis sp. LOL_012]|uniref:MFS transporter n=1 Tax=Nocardiopsis sp. LOL_012 TaxID=3345409 RepID=UPI003A83CA95